MLLVRDRARRQVPCRLVFGEHFRERRGRGRCDPALAQPREQAVALAPRAGEGVSVERKHRPPAVELESGDVTAVADVQARNRPAARVESPRALPLHVT